MCAKIAPKTSGLVGDPPEIVAPGQDLKTATRPGKHTKNHGKSPCLMGKPWENGDLYGKSPCFMGRSIISMAIFNSYFDKTRGYIDITIFDG